MLIGAFLFFVLLGALAVVWVGASRKVAVWLEPEIQILKVGASMSPAPEGLEPFISEHAYEPAGEYGIRYTPPDPRRGGDAAHVQVWLSPDRTIFLGAVRYWTYVFDPEPSWTSVAIASQYLLFLSVDAEGRQVHTHNRPREEPFSHVPRHHYIWRPDITAPLELLLLHQRQVRRRGFRPVPLDRGDYPSLIAGEHRETVETLAARGFLRRDESVARGTTRCGLLTLGYFFLPHRLEPRPGLAGLVMAALALGGAGAAWAASAFLPDLAGPLAIAIFALLTLCCQVSFDLARWWCWGYVCLPAAVVLHVHGVRGGIPWLVAFGVWISGNVLIEVIRAARARRELARLQKRGLSGVLDPPLSERLGISARACRALSLKNQLRVQEQIAKFDRARILAVEVEGDSLLEYVILTPELILLGRRGLSPLILERARIVRVDADARDCIGIRFRSFEQEIDEVQFGEDPGPARSALREYLKREYAEFSAARDAPASPA